MLRNIFEAGSDALLQRKVFFDNLGSDAAGRIRAEMRREGERFLARVNRLLARGHLLGREHEAEGVMQATLSAGIRRTVAPTFAEDASWLGAAQILSAWNEDTPGRDQGFASRHGKRR